MAQIRKMDCQVEIKSQADKFYDVFKTKIQQMPKICTQLIKDVKLVQGDWDSNGAVIEWFYVANEISKSKLKIKISSTNDLSGKSEKFLEETLDADVKNKTIAFRGLEGEIMKNCKSWKTTLKVTPKGMGSLVKWTAEYENKTSVPDPVIYLDFYTIWTNIVDAYILNA
ncbi:hypothetical protein PTKIN_Ptkin02bG0054100 [Pterospermum kingtungense]